MRRFEVFNPIDGSAVCFVPFAWLAAGICELFRPVFFFDWERAGEGWPPHEDNLAAYPGTPFMPDQHAVNHHDYPGFPPLG